MSQSSDVPQQGNETRSSILPTAAPGGLGFFGSPYSAADQLPNPVAYGCADGDSMDSVMGCVGSVGAYVDTIGFGQSSSFLTAGLPIKPLGVNYFMNTGQICDNGATMYEYFQGIPEGNALGKKIQRAMSQMGLPALRGLAPGMVEDAENALNPMPLLNSMLGSGYPQCMQITKQVGDMTGAIADPETGVPWIENPETANRGANGLYYQTRWVQALDSNGYPITLDKVAWDATPKSLNPDGTPKSVSGFQSMITSPPSLAVLGILLVLGFAFVRPRLGA